MSREHAPPPILDEVLITDLAVLRQLANPLRLRLAFFFREPHSVAEVAELMDVPVTRLYYHLRILEDAGVIVVVERRKRGPQIEKVYRIVAHTIRPSSSILEGGASPMEFAEVAASLVLDSARAELTTSLAQHAARGFDPSTIDGSLGRTLVRLPRDRALELIAELEAMVHAIKRSESTDPDDLLYGFTYTLFPIEVPQTPPPGKAAT